MLPENIVGPGGGEGGGVAVPVGNRVAEEKNPGGDAGVGANGNGEGAQEGVNRDTGITGAPPAAEHPGDRGREDGGESEKNNPPEIPKRSRCTITDGDFIAACKAANGNVTLLVTAIGLTRASIYERIRRNPELSALYSPKRRQTDGDKPPVTEAETLLRKPPKTDESVGAADMADVVSKAERVLLGGGLKKLGIPEATITQLKDLRSMQIEFGAFLAVSLQHMQQGYYLELLRLMARAKQIYEIYLDPESRKYTASLEPMERMFWQRAHTEVVEQLGKGMDRMMAGTQAMVAMMKNKKNGAPAPQQIQAGWETQVPKSVKNGMKKY